MPSKRRTTDSDDGSESTQPSSKRQVSHASRACDECRKRKIRCDGLYPQCSVCKTRKLHCHYNDEDRRKTNVEHMEGLNQRMNGFEDRIDQIHSLLNRLLDASVSSAGSGPPVAGRGSQEPAVSNNVSPPIVSGPSRVHAAPQSTVEVPTGDVGVPSVLAEASQPVFPAIPPESSPISSTRLSFIQGGDEHDRFQRMEEGSGALVQYGPTSLWSAASPRPRQALPPSPRGRQLGDWVDWSKNLPSSLDISRAIHDQALEYFDANYAPWCSVVDMANFLEDLSTCNLITGKRGDPQGSPFRTAHYSPLLHCCVLYLGLQLTRHEHPGLFSKYENIFLAHCFKLLPVECDQIALSSLRAYSLFSVCAHYNRTSLGQSKARIVDRQNATGYLYSGIAIAGVHALGLDIDCQAHVLRGEFTEAERHERILTFWTIYVQDVFRALASGRQPMLPEATFLPLPRIDSSIDERLWKAPNSAAAITSGLSPHARVRGIRSMQSTTFHWTVRLAILCRAILDRLYGPNSKGARDAEAAADLLRQLETWYTQLPLHPAEATPLPHILHLHMQYHLCVIFVLRSFYRLGHPAWAGKCDQAAMSILPLLRLLDATHGIQHCHHSFINIIFGAATIFLLRSVDPSDDSRSTADTERFNECVGLLSPLSQTWSEAAMSEYILLKLQNEFLVSAADSDISQAAPAPLANDALGDLDALWGSMFSDQVQQWSDMLNGGQAVDGLPW